MKMFYGPSAAQPFLSTPEHLGWIIRASEPFASPLRTATRSSTSLLASLTPERWHHGEVRLSAWVT
jgi:hypothetical protein